MSMNTIKGKKEKCITTPAENEAENREAQTFPAPQSLQQVDDTKKMWVYAVVAEESGQLSLLL